MNHREQKENMGSIMTTQQWSEAERGALRVLAGNQSATEIGKQLGRSKKSVLNQIARLHLPNLPAGFVAQWSDADSDALLHAEPGIGAEEYARVHGFGVGTVRYWAKKLGVVLTPGIRWTEPERQILRAARTIDAAVMALHRSRRAVYDYARLIGVPLAGTRRVMVNRQAYKRTAPRLAAARVQAPRKPPVAVEWCSTCHCPVSNWAQHYGRMPECRIERAG